MKQFKLYAIVWALALGIFNLCTFLVPATENAAKFTAAFWVGYVAITLALLIHLIASFFALRILDAARIFYRLPFLTGGYVTLALMLLCGGIFMAVPGLPYWGGIILCSAVLAVQLVLLVRALGAVQAVEAVEKANAASTAFFRELSLLSLSLCTTAPESLRATVRRVHEAIRFSDPIATEGEAECLTELRCSFTAFSDAVEGEDNELATNTANEFLTRLDRRNALARALKKKA